MTLNFTLSGDIAERIAVIAEKTSQTPEQLVVAAVQRNLDSWELWRRADEALAPVRAAFKASGMTEDEAVEMFEAEKHAMRRERRAAGEL